MTEIELGDAYQCFGCRAEIGWSLILLWRRNRYVAEMDCLRVPLDRSDCGAYGDSYSETRRKCKLVIFAPAAEILEVNPV